MTALLVILTIVLLVCIDAGQLYVKRIKSRSLNKDIIEDPINGLCMCDGAKKEE